MSLRNFIRQTRLLLAQSLYEMRRAMTTKDDSLLRAMQVTQLEERILMSASPLAVVAEAPDAGGSQGNDQQLLDVVADTVLPEQSATANTVDDQRNAGGDPLDVVLIDSSLSDVDVLMGSVDEDAVVILYDGADDTIIDVLAQVEGLAEASAREIGSLSILSHGSGGQFDLGGEVVTDEMTADQSAAWQTLADNFSEDANIYVYGCDVVDTAGEGQELLDLLSELTGTEVYGSDDTTGAGGDWDLEAVSIGGEHEFAAGTIAPLNAAALSRYQGTLAEPTLVAHWTFDEASGQTLTDITGNGNDGTLGSTVGADGNDPTWTIDGTRGSVLTFDGNQDYVTGIGNSPSGSFTVAGWGNTTSGGPSAYHAMYSADTEIWLGVDDASGFIYMYVGGINDYVYTANNTWTHDTWHHLAGTWDGTSAHIYIDGADQSLTTVGTLNDPTATAAVIGAWSTNLTQDEWNGSMDDLLIYDDALDSTAITRLANDAPTAVDVAFTTDEDIAVTTSDVLSAGFDPNDDTLSIDSFTHGTNGTVVDNNDGTLTYTPDANFDGIDTFTYTVNDGNGNTDTATVTVTVNPVAPVITARETVDSDGNGQIDRIRITTDENLDDDFTGLTMTVAGYTVTGYSSDIANDNIFYVDLTESGTADTNATPDVTVTANTSLSDAGNYNIATDDWWDTDWLNRREITFDNTASAENLDDFPLLVALTSSDINYAKTQDQGQDIRFYDTDTGQLLKYEIEEWNEAGTSYVWVRVPRIDAGVSTDSIMMYYNNTAALDGQDADNVWDSSFQMVYHANESSGNLQDSTSNTNDGTAAGTAGYGATGAIGSGIDLERDDSARFVVNSLTLNPSTTDLTIQAWIRPEDINVSQPFFSQKNGTGQGRTLLKLDTTNEAVTWLGGTPLSADTALGSGTFYHLVLTYDNTAGVVHFYLNGASDSADISASAESATGSWVVGSHKDEGSFFDGIIDEMRVSSTIRSADWIEAEYLSQNGAFSFNTFGNEENQSGSSITAVDKAAAAITARETVDSDGNGRIDQIRITASEALDDDFTGLTMTVAGYTVTGYSSDIANDNIFYIDLTESGTPDTDATPAVALIANTTLGDASSNDIAVDVAWWDSSWLNRTKITFDNTNSAENLTDFPVLIKLAATDIDFAKINAGGADIRFVDDDGTLLDYEIEAWDDSPGTESASIWVRVQQLDSASSTDYIHLYYNNTAATDAQNAAGVWDSNFAGVYHLGETVVDEQTSGTHVDSAGTNDGSQNGNASILGMIGGAQEFDGTSDSIDVGAITGTSNTVTMSGWIKYDSLSATIERTFNFGDQFVVRHDGANSVGQLHFYIRTDDVVRSIRVNGALADDVWYHVAATWDGTTQRLYLDGTEVGSQVPGGTLTTPTSGRLSKASGDGMDGVVDEFEVSTVARSADWIEASFLSQNGNFAFTSFGSEEVTTTDKSGPVILSMDMSDSNLIAGETSTVTVTFSEAVQDVSGFLPDNGTVSVATSADGGVTWTSTFTPTDGIVDSTNNLFLLGWFDDLANNSTFALEAPGNYTIETTTPTITARETIDSDANGQIDTIRITTDENLDDDFTGLTVTVAGYTVTGYSSDIANDNIFYVDLTESGTPDTGATPAVTVTANTTLSDAAGNNTAVDAGLTATDKAAAVLISASTPQSTGSNLFQAQGQQLDLVFSETLGSSISEVNLEAALLFAAGATDGDNLPTIGTGTNPISLVTTSDTNDTIRITYNANNSANANRTLVGTHTVRVTTGTNITDVAGNTANTAGTAVTITGDTNDAPVLDNTGTMTLTTISEEDFTSSGDTVANIILSASGDRITDNDTVPVEGMAVIGVDDTNGTWQYNTGSGWNAFGAVSNTSAVLLNPSATIRFVPDANYAGSSGDITFRAWDQTSGSNGDTAVNVSGNGGTTAFSTATETASLTVTGVNDDPVITSSSTASVAENQTATLTVTSTDIDGGTPTYSLSGGADQTKFSINSSTGVLTFSTAPDFETPTDVGTNNVYEVQVTVSDGAGGTDVQSISVTVTDVNDDPIITSSSTASVAENQTAVLTVTTTDQDVPADTITYSLTGGADQTKFAINSTTGVLTFNTAPDFETPTDVGTNNVYDVQVTANDGAGGSDVQSISVTVTDVNDAPIITSSSTASVAENQTAVLTVTSTDEDLPSDTMTYSLSGGADQTKFSINSSTGVLTFSTAPDFESPTDVGTNNVYDVQVTVSDGAGGTDVQSISVTVTDANDAPIITSSSTASVAENQTAALTVTTTDADFPADTITYSLTGGADQTRFSINASTGVLTFNTPPDFETPTDVGTNNIYDVQVTASDGAGGTDVQSISVTVTDVNESPTITPIADQTPLEDTATGAIAFTVGDPETAAGSLTVTATSNNQTIVPDGNITLGGSGANRTINVLPGTNQNGGPATITVTVNDGNTTSVTTFDITITAVNDAPTLSTIANQVVQEDTATGAIAFTVGDVETPAGTLTVTAHSNDQTLVPDGNITLGGSGANRTINVLPGVDQLGGPATITVTVDDGTTSTQTTFDVTVTPVNDAPTISLPGSAVNFTEGDAATVIDSLAMVADVDSPDFDTGTLTVDFTVGGTANDRLTINNQGSGSGQIGVSGAIVAYEGVTIGTFVGGTDGSTPLVVTLNANATPSAVQALTRNISYENISEDPSTAARTVRFVLTDGDSGTSSGETETINLTAVNDSSVIATDPTTLTYTGLSAVEVDPTLTITDVDDNLLVSAEARLSNGFIQGEDALVFVDQLGITGAFSGTTGILTLTGSTTLANYETALRSVQYNNVSSSPTLGLLWVEFTVNDGTDDSTVARRRVEIIDEDPPRATNDSATLAEGGSVVIDLAANDSDNFDLLDLNSIAILTGPSNGTLVINGDGTVTYTHDGSETTSDLFTYTIEDTSDLLSNTATVALTITPVNEVPTDISLSGSVVDENSANGTLVGNAAGTDIDAGDSLTFSLTNDAGGRFAVDLNTGQLTVADGSLLNFEAASSHAITIRVTDSGGLTYDESFTISLNDINEAPTALDDAFSARQLEDLVVPAGVIMTNDFDVDGDSITVVLVTGPADGTLTLAADGSFTYTPIEAFSGLDQFTYYVTDGTLNSEVATVSIDVAISITPVDATPPVAIEPPPETVDNAVESEPAETTDTESADDISNDAAEAESITRPPVAAAPESTTGQDSGASTKTDNSVEMVSQTENAIFVSAFLNDVPEVEAVDKDTRTQQNGAEQTVDGGPDKTGRFLVRQTDAVSLLFEIDRINSTDTGYGQQTTEFFAQQQMTEKMVLGTSAAFSTSVSVGYLIWLLRGGSLLTTFLSSLPTWQTFDALAVLESFDENGAASEDTESLTSLVTGGE